jgi:hypothetical protein
MKYATFNLCRVVTACKSNTDKRLHLPATLHSANGCWQLAKQNNRRAFYRKLGTAK